MKVGGPRMRVLLVVYVTVRDICEYAICNEGLLLAAGGHMAGKNLISVPLEDLGHALADIRKSLGLTTRAASERCQLARPTLINFEVHPDMCWKSTTLDRLLAGYGYRAKIVLEKIDTEEEVEAGEDEA